MLTSQDITSFQKDGAILIQNVLDRKWLDLLARGIDRNKRSRGPWACDYTKPGDSGEFWDDYCNWQRINEYKFVLFNSPLATIAQQIMQSQKVRLFHEHVLVKEAHTSEETPWHHDQPYYCVDGNQLVSTWVPLDPITKESAMKFIAGSHLGPMYAPKRFHDNESYDYEGFAELPQISETLTKDKIRSWEMQPGDVLIFHMRTLHAAGGTATRRRAFAARWLGDDATYATRPGPTSPPFPGLEHELAPGSPMDHELFPQIQTSI